MPSCLSDTSIVFYKKSHLIAGIAMIGALTVNFALAQTLYQVVTPDGRTVTVNNPAKAYQLNPDPSKITTIDTNSLPSPSLATDSTDNLNGTLSAPTTSAYTTTTNTAQSTTTVTVAPPMTPLPLPSSETITPAVSEFEELNISSTAASKTGDYRLALVTPVAETLYRKPAQAIDVVLTVTPALKKGDTISLEIDNQVIKNGTQTTYQLPSTDIPPDKHLLTVKILNVLNQPIATANRQFYVVQNNPLIQKKRQLAKQMAAYEALPWYEKLKIRLGIVDNQPNTANALNPSANK